MVILGALDTETNKYVTPYTAEKGRSYKCIDCQQHVLFRKGTIRKVHFAHYSPTNTCAYYEHPNESQLHKEAKYKIQERLNNKFPIRIFNSCPECSIFPTEFDEQSIEYSDGDEAIVEYRDPNNKYIADVSLVNNGKVKYIFEVKYTHATTTSVRPEPWFEVNAKEIFDEEERLLKNDKDDNIGQVIILICIRTSKNRWCQNCRINKEAWVQNLPSLIKKNGHDMGWQQVKPCIKCGSDCYSPVFAKGYYQICKMCICEYEEELKKEYGMKECIIMDD